MTIYKHGQRQITEESKVLSSLKKLFVSIGGKIKQLFIKYYVVSKDKDPRAGRENFKSLRALKG